MTKRNRNSEQVWQGARTRVRQWGRLGTIAVSGVLLLAACSSGDGGGDQQADNPEQVSGTTSAAEEPTSGEATTTTEGSASAVDGTPRQLAEQGYLNVGVRCGIPSRGFINDEGVNAGFDPDVARKLAEYAFGDPEAATFVCVTAANRIPYLTSGRVDLLLATLGYTSERAEVIDFSIPYYGSFGKLLTREDANDFDDLSGVEGETVLTVTGTPYVDWLEACSPAGDVVHYEAPADGLADLANGRGFAFVHDAGTINPASEGDNYKLNGPDVLDVGFQTNAGIRQGDDELREWVDASILRMQEEDYFVELVERHFPEGLQRTDAMNVIRRPGETPNYEVFTGGEINC